MSKLTNTQIKNTKGKDKPYSLSDGLGLSLLVNTNGNKWWRYRFQFDGKAKMMSLGVYPDVSLAEVRKRLYNARSLVADGINPLSVKLEPDGDSVQFETVVKDFLESFKKDVSLSHYKRGESLLRLYAVPRLGKHQISDITHKDIRGAVVAVADAEKKESAKKLYGILSRLFSYAVNHDICEINVVKLVDFETGFFDSINKRKYPTITEPTQVKLLLENIEAFEGAHHATTSALLFMALTSLRPTNVRNARWSMIDFKNKTMTIPKKEMKIEKKKLHKSDDFILPLSAQTIELLDKVKTITGHGRYIFPSIRGDRPMSENAMLVYIRSLGYTKEQFVPHGFRAMFATIANEHSEFDRDLIDAQLAHKVGDSVSQAYNRTNYLQKRVALSQWWSDWLDALK